MKRTVYTLRLTTLIFASLIFISSCIAQKNKVEVGAKWEAEMAAFDKLNQTEKYSDNSLLFVGSSSIRLWSTIKEEMAPYPIIQRGFGGSDSPAVAQYAERIVYPHQFRAVVIFIANDITGSPNDLSPKESAATFRKIVKTIRAKYRKQPVFLIEITPSQSRWKKWPLIKENNALLKALCHKQKNLYFIETAQSFLNEKGEPRNELFRDDHLHLNREGYKIWGALIKAEIDKVLNQKDKG
jgi:lysophospholipase L1-like esterase